MAVTPLVDKILRDALSELQDENAALTSQLQSIKDNFDATTAQRQVVRNKIQEIQAALA